MGKNGKIKFFLFFYSKILIIKLFTLTIKVCIISFVNFDNQSNGGKSMLERIQKVFEETMNVDASEVVPTANLAEDLDIDSLAAVELALELENEFGIEISDDELANLKTVQDVMDCIASK